jgi:hypothetical protein
MATKTTKAKDAEKSRYTSQCIYQGTRKRSGAAARLYRVHALASLEKLQQKRDRNNASTNEPRRQYA